MLHRLKTRPHSLAAMLGAAFLFAQGVALVHDLDPKAHDVDHACEICIHASLLGGANVAVETGFEFVAPDRSVEPAATVVHSSLALWRARARAPPVQS